MTYIICQCSVFWGLRIWNVSFFLLESIFWKEQKLLTWRTWNHMSSSILRLHICSRTRVKRPEYFISIFMASDLSRQCPASLDSSSQSFERIAILICDPTVTFLNSIREALRVHVAQSEEVPAVASTRHQVSGSVFPTRPTKLSIPAGSGN